MFEQRVVKSGPDGSPPAATDASGRKRDQLVAFIDRKLAPHAAVQAIVAFGSVATGTARPDSDIDAYVFMEPLDAYLVPAESVWRERDDTFHSIFSDDSTLGEDGVQLDFHRPDLAVWREPDFAWPEHALAELADGWVAFDRHGAVAPLVTARTTYPDDARLHAIDEAVTFVAAQLPDQDDAPPAWSTLDAVELCDGLQAAYDYLVRALFAYNRRWLPWRHRQLRTMLRLPWLPADFEHHVMDAAISSGHDHAAYLTRAGSLRQLLAQLLQRLVADGIYHADGPISQAFKRAHDEPGRAWNMTAWTTEHQRHLSGGRPRRS